MMPAPHDRPNDPEPAPRPRARRSVAASLCIAAAVLMAPAPAQGQEYDSVSGSSEKAARSGDHTKLAELGLDPATLDRANDVALLWRAVRELVLPGRVSDDIQRRVLRRLWQVDPDIANGSYIESETN